MEDEPKVLGVTDLIKISVFFGEIVNTSKKDPPRLDIVM